MLVIFYVNTITFEIFNLPHIYRIFVGKTHFLRWKFQINHMVSKCGSYYMKCHGSIYLQFS
jgi:hypothetical protein